MSTITYEEVLSLFKETDQRMKETDQLMKEQSREADLRMKETDRQIKELGKQIGGLGEKFGYFTEGLALPSMERILTEEFGMSTVLPRARTRKNGEAMQLDALAYTNDDSNLAMLVEIKSRVRMESIEQLRKIMLRFRRLFPEHAHRTLMGILAGVDWDLDVAEKAREAGFLTASIRDEMFELTVPKGFQARGW
uniref:DUF3782 domain-containing protein n=1 Tax=Candidatus Kentrum sp. SD TaxID=2126332 RepID=A0A450Y4V6_9GAMM|nr:MAG: hypothetical protein BECKSD772F_GA0070984_100254 [Candidatus Kentron sp. SD]VFK39228.1 MAG: hypothetical protein BECKSD772E_GA0070983_100252 [Candidatus Kentron sp. SD]